VPYPHKKCVEQQRQVLLRGICERNLNHIRHLLTIAVEEASLERPCGTSDSGDILLSLGLLKLLALLAFRGRGNDGSHGDLWKLGML
jgi:hypothetical protein